jgi:peptidoglycan hydrolase-like protein with peptidoglycan-binding domain
MGYTAQQDAKESQALLAEAGPCPQQAPTSADPAAQQGQAQDVAQASSPTSALSAFEPFKLALAGQRSLTRQSTTPETTTALQVGLNALQHDCGTPDGAWGGKTDAALRSFQSSQKLTPDAVIGPKSALPLDAKLNGVSLAAPAIATPAAPTAAAPTPAPTATPGAAPLQAAPAQTQQQAPAGAAPTTAAASPAAAPIAAVSGATVAATFRALLDPKQVKNDAQAQALIATIAQDVGLPATVQAKIPAGSFPAADAPTLLNVLSQVFADLLAQAQQPGVLADKDQTHVLKRIDAMRALYAGQAASPQADNPVRLSIISTALGEIGKVSAYTVGGVDEKGKKTRQGWERLDQIFETSYGGRTTGFGGGYNQAHQDIVKHYGEKPQSWCGHFAMWAYKNNGINVGDWVAGKGPSSLYTTLTPQDATTYTPRPGDIAYAGAHSQHYAIVVRVEGQTIHTIDGNTGGDSVAGGCIGTNSRAKSWFSGFFSIKD